MDQNAHVIPFFCFLKQDGDQPKFEEVDDGDVKADKAPAADAKQPAAAAAAAAPAKGDDDSDKESDHGTVFVIMLINVKQVPDINF